MQSRIREFFEKRREEKEREAKVDDALAAYEFTRLSKEGLVRGEAGSLHICDDPLEQLVSGYASPIDTSTPLPPAPIPRNTTRVFLDAFSQSCQNSYCTVSEETCVPHVANCGGFTFLGIAAAVAKASIPAAQCNAVIGGAFFCTALVRNTGKAYSDAAGATRAARTANQADLTAYRAGIYQTVQQQAQHQALQASPPESEDECDGYTPPAPQSMGG